MIAQMKFGNIGEAELWAQRVAQGLNSLNINVRESCKRNDNIELYLLYIFCSDSVCLIQI